jgi:hypothetical protein
MTTFIVTMVIAVGVTVALIVGIDAALEWLDRRRNPDMCSPMHPCPECEGPRSNLDRWDRGQP